MDPWVQAAAADIARRAERELEALVAVSSPSGDVHGAEECAALCAALAPDEAQIERPPCSSPAHAPDLLATLRGTGRRRVLLLGHVDTVVAHEAHRPLERRDGHLLGSGTVDMKGGDVLALGALRALAARPDRYAEVALLLVCDEEWRTGAMHHVERFAGWDACLCFEAGELAPDGAEAVVVQRKAAATVHVTARGRSAHSGSAPDRGRNALLALAAAAQAVAAQHDPHGPLHLSSVPTVMRSGDAFNVVPGHGELFCDCRADDHAAVDDVIAAVPEEVGGVRLHADTIRRWPAMAHHPAVDPVLERASERLGRRIVGVKRGGASDASHMAASVPVTIDGLGPRGGKAHNPGEYVVAESLHSRAEVALAVIDAVLG
jgi:glutamate carboxypeptidase